jgi:Tfp pilus assembly protein PilZ
MENDNQKIQELGITDQLIERIKSLSLEKQAQLLKELDEGKNRVLRQHDRKIFFMTVDYIVDGKYFRDFIQDMSSSGVFINTSQTFSLDQTILMTFMSPDNQQPFKMNGEIVRVTPDGVGVRFKIESQVQEVVIEILAKMIQNV